MRFVRPKLATSKAAYRQGPYSTSSCGRYVAVTGWFQRISESVSPFLMIGSMDFPAFAIYVVAATALLGSPGPAIAALVTIGRAQGLRQGLRYFCGLQIGLALAAIATATGLISLFHAWPWLFTAMSWLAVAYLLHMGYRMIVAPIGGNAESDGNQSSSFLAGMLLGGSNPKAYVAFAALFASQSLSASPQVDISIKVVACIVVMVVVDAAWLSFGAVLRNTRLNPGGERSLNLLLGASVVVTAILMLI
jgi:threonine/homoserine/homoserine lactone efflux protein